MQGDDLKKELLSKKNEDLEIQKTLYIAKNENTCSSGNTKSVVKQPFDKKIMEVLYGFRHLCKRQE
jgi:hypothetical protein